MPLKTVFAPPLNRPVKMGRLRPVPPPKPALRFESFLGDAALPAPPAAVDYAPKGQPALRNVYGNDRLGDCVVAGGYHLLALTTGNATGTPFVAAPAQIVADYSAIGGYAPGDPATDNGCDEVTALNYWTSHGFANGDRLAGWLAVDATNPTLLRQAMWLFENLFFGIELPGGWLDPFPQRDGFTWGLNGGPDPNNGHCVVATGYTAAGPTLDTWGLSGTLTDAAAAAYAVPRSGGEAYVLLFPDMIPRGREVAPNGFAWDRLVAYFDAIGGRVLIPVGPPPAPPAPAPPAPAPTPALPPGSFLIEPLSKTVTLPLFTHTSRPPGGWVGWNELVNDFEVPPDWTIKAHGNPAAQGETMSNPVPAAAATPAAVMTETAVTGGGVLALLTRALAFVPGHVNLPELSRAVIAAELAAPGLQSAVAAVKANEVTIFPDAASRIVADMVLSLLVDTGRHASRGPDALTPAAPASVTGTVSDPDAKCGGAAPVAP